MRVKPSSTPVTARRCPAGAALFTPQSASRARLMGQMLLGLQSSATKLHFQSKPEEINEKRVKFEKDVEKLDLKTLESNEDIFDNPTSRISFLGDLFELNEEGLESERKRLEREIDDLIEQI
jgi:hypothetical protein